ncbi:hypothetical protein [Shewanella woodyi]|nr:hypothetical protein [Shewanella woodyi]
MKTKLSIICAVLIAASTIVSTATFAGDYTCSWGSFDPRCMKQ